MARDSKSVGKDEGSLVVYVCLQTPGVSGRSVPEVKKKHTGIRLIWYQSNCHTFRRKENHEPGRREKERDDMVDSVNRTPRACHCRGSIFTVEFLDGIGA